MQLTAAFRSVHADIDLWQIRSVSLFRHGRIIAESYMKDDIDRIQERQMWSCTKQIIGILIGIAFDQNLLASLDDPIEKYMPAVQGYSDKRSITIRHLLTMSSGIAYTNDGFNGQTINILQQKPDDLLDYILSRPLNTQPGQQFSYKDGDTQLLSILLEHVTGKPTHLWAQDVLFQPLGIKRMQWLRYKDGATLGAFGILSTPREMSKIAQCVMNGGMYNGRQIISRQWIQRMITRQIRASNYAFGFQWWISEERNVFFMSGNGGQYFVCYPEKQCIVAITSEPNTLGNFRILNTQGLNIAQQFFASVR